MSSQLGKEDVLPEQVNSGRSEGAQIPKGLLQKARDRIKEAIEAGREAAREKEEAMRQEFERSINPRH